MWTSTRILLAVTAAVGPAVARGSALAAAVPCGGVAGSPTHLAFRVAAMPTLADIFALNRDLAARGRPALPHPLATSGGDLVVRRGWLVLDGAADVVIPRSTRNAAYSVATGGTLDEGVVGVALFCAPSWTIYPLAGVGTTRLDLATGPAQGETVDTVLAGGTAGGALSSRTLFDDYGLGVDYQPRGERGGRLSAGMRIGYFERFGRANWHLAGQPIAGGPKYGLSGPYLRAAVGLGF